MSYDTAGDEEPLDVPYYWPMLEPEPESEIDCAECDGPGPPCGRCPYAHPGSPEPRLRFRAGGGQW